MNINWKKIKKWFQVNKVNISKLENYFYWKEKDYLKQNNINQPTTFLETSKTSNRNFMTFWLKKKNTALTKKKRGKKGSDYRLRIYIPSISWMVLLLTPQINYVHTVKNYSNVVD